MLSPFQWVRRRIEIARHAPRRRELEAELTQIVGAQVKLDSIPTRRGYDEIYYARRSGQRFAVMRVNNDFGRAVKPSGPDAPVVPLEPRARLEREWTSYQQLCPIGLSPSPIWRTDDAIVCGWIDWPRASETLIRRRNEFWPLMECILPAIRRMHQSGVTHLDLNLGNMLTEPGTRQIAFIDFEFGPVDGMTLPQQHAFDYLRLIDECVRPRRGGRQMLSDTGRLVHLLGDNVDHEAREAATERSLPKLRRLAAHPELRQQLRAVFRRL